MPACHAGDRGFKSRPDRHLYYIQGFVAQLVEQRIEDPCVAGSTPAEATILSLAHLGIFFSDKIGVRGYYANLQSRYNQRPTLLSII